MAYNEDFSWPMSGNEGPDFEWEHVPIQMPAPLEFPQILPLPPDDHEGAPGEEGTPIETIPSPPSTIQKVRTIQWEEVKGVIFVDLFDKLDKEIIMADENGKKGHHYYLFGELDNRKHYQCINKDCYEGLIVVPIRNPKETIEFPSSPRKIQEGEEDDGEDDH